MSSQRQDDSGDRVLTDGQLEQVLVMVRNEAGNDVDAIDEQLQEEGGEIVLDTLLGAVSTNIRTYRNLLNTIEEVEGVRDETVDMARGAIDDLSVKVDEAEEELE